jgi:hypothetical protein
MAFGEASDCHPFPHGLRNNFSKNDGARQEAFIIFQGRQLRPWKIINAS